MSVVSDLTKLLIKNIHYYSTNEGSYNFASHFGWYIWSCDIKNVLLFEKLHEEIYTGVPTSYENDLTLNMTHSRRNLI